MVITDVKENQSKGTGRQISKTGPNLVTVD